MHGSSWPPLVILHSPKQSCYYKPENAHSSQPNDWQPENVLVEELLFPFPKV